MKRKPTSEREMEIKHRSPGGINALESALRLDGANSYTAQVIATLRQTVEEFERRISQLERQAATPRRERAK